MDFRKLLDEMREAENTFPEVNESKLTEADSLKKGPDKDPAIKANSPDLANVNEDIPAEDEEIENDMQEAVREFLTTAPNETIVELERTYTEPTQVEIDTWRETILDLIDDPEVLKDIYNLYVLKNEEETSPAEDMDVVEPELEDEM